LRRLRTASHFGVASTVVQASSELPIRAFGALTSHVRAPQRGIDDLLVIRTSARMKIASLYASLAYVLGNEPLLETGHLGQRGRLGYNIVV
jgi:hypothetical protein